MFASTLSELYARELGKLRTEINLYPDEQSIWLVKGDIANAAGNLCLHVFGNLNHFIGAVLGNTGYVRDRPYEFSATGIPRNTLIVTLDDTLQVVQTTLANITDAQFYEMYPAEKNGEKVTMSHLLIHLLAHLNYHLGQVNYHRRLIG